MPRPNIQPSTHRTVCSTSLFAPAGALPGIIARDSVSPWSACLPVALAVALLACTGGGDAPAPAASVTVRDSAGLRIVETEAPAWTEPGQGWRLSAEPTLQIGMVEGAPEYMFDRIMGAVRFEDGTLAVGTMGSGSIRYYDAEGTFLREAGRPGEGPGEFRQLMGLQYVAGDSLLARSGGRTGYHVYGADGGFGRSVSPPVHEDERGFWSSYLPLTPGTFVMSAMPPPGPREGAPVDSAWLGLHDGVALQDLDRLPFIVWSEGADPRRFPQEFGPALGVAEGGDRVFFSFSADPDVTMIRLERSPETGRPTVVAEAVLRRPWTPEPVTEEDIEAFKHAYAEEATLENGQPATEAFKQFRRSHFERMTFAEQFPAHGRLLADRTGGLWMQEYFMPAHTASWNPTTDEATLWHAYTPDGAWMGPVEFPAGFHPFEIGDDYVLGLWRDDMDVEYVRLYALEKG